MSSALDQIIKLIDFSLKLFKQKKKNNLDYVERYAQPAYELTIFEKSIQMLGTVIATAEETCFKKSIPDIRRTFILCHSRNIHQLAEDILTLGRCKCSRRQQSRQLFDLIADERFPFQDLPVLQL
jgi:hypothetical protein